MGTPFLYYLIGLQGIPDGYYEAAQIDGANKIQTFFHITLPMLTPTLFFRDYHNHDQHVPDF